MISICIAIKNRSRIELEGRELRLFPRCVASIAEATSGLEPCELVVADWDSDDWPLADWLEEAAAPLPVRIVRMSGGFSRGRGLNAAAREARGDCLLFTDADSLLGSALFERGIECCRNESAFFPVLFSYDGPEHCDGWWRNEGYGNCMVPRALFERSGGWPEYETWGREDDDFHERLSAIAPVVRERVAGFFHQWHPDDAAWKNRYSIRAADIARELEQAARTRDEIVAATPPDAVVILVDEARFGSEPIVGRATFPFLEENDEYAGPPSDDDAGLRELERLRDKGATHIAFAWMAFWWLEYYSRFSEHLRSSFTCLVENERLVLFELGPRALRDEETANNDMRSDH
jgi:glycosyltransferase involved in cell wall biosynthesis